mgnify:CR=1 FL=1
MIEKPETYGLPDDVWDIMPDEVKKMHIEAHERSQDELKHDIMNDFHITEHDWNSMRASVKKVIQHLYREVMDLDGRISDFQDWHAQVPI